MQCVRVCVSWETFKAKLLGANLLLHEQFPGVSSVRMTQGNAVVM